MKILIGAALFLSCIAAVGQQPTLPEAPPARPFSVSINLAERYQLLHPKKPGDASYTTQTLIGSGLYYTHKRITVGINYGYPFQASVATSKGNSSFIFSSSFRIFSFGPKKLR